MVRHIIRPRRPATIVEKIKYLLAWVVEFLRPTTIVEKIKDVLECVVEILRFIKEEYLMYDQEHDTEDDSDEDSNRRQRRKSEWEHVQETLRRIFLSPLTMKRILILSCVAVSIDPLFFYIPVINDEKKCLGIDKNLRAAALCLRALPDAAFALHTINSAFRLYQDGYTTNIIGILFNSFLSILVAVFLMLPIPQLAIVVFFFKSGGSGHFGQRVTVNIFVFIYYVARVFLIFIYSQNLKYQTGKWVRASFNFLFYIIASHVVGGFWYFFSIQREISCWDQSCRNARGCGPTYYCSDSTSRDITFLNELCPINPQNTTILNFGIFFNAIQSGSTRSIHFPTKFFYCIWWGVKNLSNFGTNLETSSYVWENCFAVLTSIIGMLLFFYLLGNVQIYMQQAINKSLADEDKAKDLRPKIDERKGAIKIWMAKFIMPDDLKKTIMRLIRRKLVGKLDGDVDLNFMFNILPEYRRYLLQSYFCSQTVGKVKALQTMRKEELETISEYLQPKIFKENDTVVEAGQPLLSILFIISGSMQAYVPIREATIEAAKNRTLEKGMFFGEQLLDWAAKTKTFDDQPRSDETVQCFKKVEAFALTVDDLKTLVMTGKLKTSSKGEV